MRRFTLVTIIVLFVLIVIAAIFQGPALKALRHPHPARTPSPSPTSS